MTPSTLPSLLCDTWTSLKLTPTVNLLSGVLYHLGLTSASANFSKTAFTTSSFKKCKVNSLPSLEVTFTSSTNLTISLILTPPMCNI